MHRFGTKIVVSVGLMVMAAGFVMAPFNEVDTPYLGLTVTSMMTIAIGLGLTTGPATESIMGALPADKAGVGSAVNDTTRELGGTLGVAVVGSVFATVYGAAMLNALKDLGLPESVVSTAEQSIAAGLSIAQRLPAGLAADVTAAARQSFVDGLGAGSLVAAAVAALGSIVALALLPARHAVTQPALEVELVDAA